MKLFKHTITSAILLAAASGFAFAADGPPQQTGSVMQLPAIACAGPLAKIKADYRAYYDSRIDIAKHFVGDQVGALKNLRDKLKGQSPAVRTLMSQAADGSIESRQRAMKSVSQYLADALRDAANGYSDESTSCSRYGGCLTFWEESMDTHVMLSNGDYAVTACSHSTSYYNGDMKPTSGDLKMCSVLDLNNGMIWGETPLEALRLAGNRMDRSEFILVQLTSTYPMCTTAAGFATIDTAKFDEMLSNKTVDASSYLDGNKTWHNGTGQLAGAIPVLAQ